jgi:hypothetical protein
MTNLEAEMTKVETREDPAIWEDFKVIKEALDSFLGKYYAVDRDYLLPQAQQDLIVALHIVWMGLERNPAVIIKHWRSRLPNYRAYRKRMRG